MRPGRYRGKSTTGKAPTPRFLPGEWLKLPHPIAEPGTPSCTFLLVLYGYRLEDRPNEWLFLCELVDRIPKDPGRIESSLMQYSPFRTTTEALDRWRDAGGWERCLGRSSELQRTFSTAVLLKLGARALSPRELHPWTEPI